MKSRFAGVVLFWLITTWVLTNILAGQTPILYAASSLQQATPTPLSTPQAQTATYTQAKQQLDDTFKQTAALRKLIDHTQFDLGALSFALGDNSKAIVDFVTNCLYCPKNYRMARKSLSCNIPLFRAKQVSGD